MFPTSTVLVLIISAFVFTDAASQPDTEVTLIPLPLTSSAESDLLLPQDTSLRPDSNPVQSNIAATPLVMAYYPDWAGESLPPEKVDFSRFDWVDFAFGLPDETFALTWDNPDVAPNLLKRLVTTAHEAGKHVKLSVGGWTGSKHFSPAVSNDANRHTFVSNIVDVYTQYCLDGIDIDWEYPGQQGESSNTVSPSDTANFLSFLQLLRAKLPSAARITAATQTVPFAGANGSPLADVGDFASVLDWVLLMNYDTWGSSAMPGANAPLNDVCRNSTIPSANAHAGVRSWTAAGFPPSQIVLGVPAYGYLSRSSAASLRNRASSSVMAMNEEGGVDDGQIQFRELVKQGLLERACSSAASTNASSVSSADGELDDAEGAQFSLSFSPSGISLSSVPVTITQEILAVNEVSVNYDGLGSFTRYWDECSSTPFLKSEESGQIITYDDPESLKMKGEWAKEAGILGINMFDVHGDTDEWDLVDAIRKGLGL